MKNLIKSIGLIILMSISIFGFSQIPISFSQTKDTIYINSVNDPPYTINNDTVKIGQKITIITEIGGQSFNTDTNGFRDITVFAYQNGQTILPKYIINKNSQSISIGDTIPINYIATINFVVDTNISGINDISVDKINFTIFPNPAKTYFTVKSDTKIEKIEVISVTGQIVKTIDLKIFGNDVGVEYKVNVDGLVNGFYFVRINDTDVEKLIINQ